MMQPLDGSQADQEENAPGKAFLSRYTEDLMDRLQKIRNPSSFQQVANGAVPQTLEENKENYYINNV